MRNNNNIEYMNFVSEKATEDFRENIIYGEKSRGDYVYKLKNTVTGEYYIGQTGDFNSRKSNHLSKMRKGRHGNWRVQESYDKYGEKAFVMEKLHLCCPDVADFAEAVYVNLNDPKCMNIREGGKVGYTIADETKEVISRTNRTSYNMRTCGVTRQKDKRCKQGFYYLFQYYENGVHKRFSSTTLDGLQQKALAHGVTLEIFDEEVAA